MSSELEQRFAHVPRPVATRGRIYGDGQTIAPHFHDRGQLLHGSTGAVLVATAEGAWMMPPLRGMWIPAGVVHEVRMFGAVAMQSLYFAPGALAGMPERCQVVGISPLMRGLLAEAIAVPTEYDADGRDGALMRLIQHEVPRLPALPLGLPLPGAPRLAERCRAFLLQPSPHETIDAWGAALGLSRRSFTRLFRAETGLSFMQWRQQACIMAALPRLAAGTPVTTVALDLGYDNPAAFTTMFRRMLGSPPREYLRRED
jgi:AraC-like DNA-binding protein